MDRNHRIWLTGSLVAVFSLFFPSVTLAQAQCRCLVLDGNHDYVSVPPLQCFNDITIEMWIYRNDMNHNDGLFGLWNWGTCGTLHYQIMPSDGWCFSVDCDFPNCSPSTIWSGSWRHLAVTYSRGNSLQYYHNGDPTGGDASNLDHCILLQYGADLGSVAATLDDRYFYGKMDEVRIWNYARSATEINQDMYRTLTGNEPGLVLYYSFDQASDSVVVDLSPNHHDGLLAGDAHLDWSTAPVAECSYWVNWLQSPNGGEVWQMYQRDTIRWATDDAVHDALNIELNRNYPYGLWDTVATMTPDDGEEPIYVAGRPSTACRVRVSTVDGSRSDISNGNFTIVSPLGFLALVQPAQPDIALTSWSCPPQECPLSISLGCKLKNFGSESIVVSAPSPIVGGNFILQHNCPLSFTLSPGQMSTCDVTLTYDPQAEGAHCDTLQIATDAVNAIDGYALFPLSGSQTRTPATPQVVIETQGIDARLFWPPISQSVGGCSVNVTGYLVFYSPTVSGPFYYHGFTTDTLYTHNRVIQFATGMYYQVITYTGPLDRVSFISEGQVMDEAVRLLRNETK